MKLPSTQSSNSTINAVTSTKPTSTFNICDILELNNKKKNLKDDHESTHEEEDEIHEKKENLSGESEENLNDSMDEEINSKRKLLKSPSASPASHNEHEESSQDSNRKVSIKKSRKHSKCEENPQQQHQSQNSSLLSDTIHQYPHLFQNHPAMRPWFSSNGKFSAILVKKIFN